MDKDESVFDPSVDVLVADCGTYCCFESSSESDLNDITEHRKKSLRKASAKVTSKPQDHRIQQARSISESSFDQQIDNHLIDASVIIRSSSATSVSEVTKRDEYRDNGMVAASIIPKSTDRCCQERLSSDMKTVKKDIAVQYENENIYCKNVGTDSVGLISSGMQHYKHDVYLTTCDTQTDSNIFDYSRLLNDSPHNSDFDMEQSYYGYVEKKANDTQTYMIKTVKNYTQTYMIKTVETCTQTYIIKTVETYAQTYTLKTVETYAQTYMIKTVETYAQTNIQIECNLLEGKNENNWSENDTKNEINEQSDWLADAKSQTESARKDELSEESLNPIDKQISNGFVDDTNIVKATQDSVEKIRETSSTKDVSITQKPVDIVNTTIKTENSELTDKKNALCQRDRWLGEASIDVMSSNRETNETVSQTDFGITAMSINVDNACVQTDVVKKNGDTIEIGIQKSDEMLKRFNDFTDANIQTELWPKLITRLDVAVQTESENTHNDTKSVFVQTEWVSIISKDSNATTKTVDYHTVYMCDGDVSNFMQAGALERAIQRTETVSLKEENFVEISSKITVFNTEEYTNTSSQYSIFTTSQNLNSSDSHDQPIVKEMSESFVFAPLDSVCLLNVYESKHERSDSKHEEDGLALESVGCNMLTDVCYVTSTATCVIISEDVRSSLPRSDALTCTQNVGNDDLFFCGRQSECLVLRSSVYSTTRDNCCLKSQCRCFIRPVVTRETQTCKSSVINTTMFKSTTLIDCQALFLQTDVFPPSEQTMKKRSISGTEVKHLTEISDFQRKACRVHCISHCTDLCQCKRIQSCLFNVGQRNLIASGNTLSSQQIGMSERSFAMITNPTKQPSCDYVLLPIVSEKFDLNLSSYVLLSSISRLSEANSDADYLRVECNMRKAIASRLNDVLQTNTTYVNNVSVTSTKNINNVSETSIVNKNHPPGTNIVNENNFPGTNVVNENNMPRTNIVKKNNMPEKHIVNKNITPRRNIVNKNNTPGTNIVNKKNMIGTNIVNVFNMPETNIVNKNNMSLKNMANIAMPETITTTNTTSVSETEMLSNRNNEAEMVILANRRSAIETGHMLYNNNLSDKTVLLNQQNVLVLNNLVNNVPLEVNTYRLYSDNVSEISDASEASSMSLINGLSGDNCLLQTNMPFSSNLAKTNQPVCKSMSEHEHHIVLYKNNVTITDTTSGKKEEPVSLLLSRGSNKTCIVSLKDISTESNLSDISKRSSDRKDAIDVTSVAETIKTIHAKCMLSNKAKYEIDTSCGPNGELYSLRRSNYANGVSAQMDTKTHKNCVVRDVAISFKANRSSVCTDTNSTEFEDCVNDDMTEIAQSTTGTCEGQGESSSEVVDDESVDTPQCCTVGLFEDVLTGYFGKNRVDYLATQLKREICLDVDTFCSSTKRIINTDCRIHSLISRATNCQESLLPFNDTKTEMNIQWHHKTSTDDISPTHFGVCKQITNKCKNAMLLHQLLSDSELPISERSTINVNKSNSSILANMSENMSFIPASFETNYALFRFVSVFPAEDLRYWYNEVTMHSIFSNTGRLTLSTLEEKSDETNVDNLSTCTDVKFPMSFKCIMVNSFLNNEHNVVKITTNYRNSNLLYVIFCQQSISRNICSIQGITKCYQESDNCTATNVNGGKNRHKGILPQPYSQLNLFRQQVTKICRHLENSKPSQDTEIIALSLTSEAWAQTSVCVFVSAVSNDYIDYGIQSSVFLALSHQVDNAGSLKENISVSNDYIDYGIQSSVFLDLSHQVDNAGSLKENISVSNDYIDYGIQSSVFLDLSHQVDNAGGLKENISVSNDYIDYGIQSSVFLDLSHQVDNAGSLKENISVSNDYIDYGIQSSVFLALSHEVDNAGSLKENISVSNVYSNCFILNPLVAQGEHSVLSWHYRHFNSNVVFRMKRQDCTGNIDSEVRSHFFTNFKNNKSQFTCNENRSMHITLEYSQLRKKDSILNFAVFLKNCNFSESIATAGVILSESGQIQNNNCCVKKSGLVCYVNMSQSSYVYVTDYLTTTCQNKAIGIQNVVKRVKPSEKRLLKCLQEIRIYYALPAEWHSAQFRHFPNLTLRINVKFGYLELMFSSDVCKFIFSTNMSQRKK